MSQRKKARHMVAKHAPAMGAGMQPPMDMAMAPLAGLPPSAATPSMPGGAMGMDNGSDGAASSGLASYCRGGLVGGKKLPLKD